MKGRIAWLVPYPIEGSGGHRTIFSHIRNLVARGHECHVYIGADSQQSMEEEVLREVVEQFFGPCFAQIHSGYRVAEPFDLAVATAWWTAEIVAKEVVAEHKLYFVQDFEPWFNPMGDFYLKAENSYQQGLTPLTIGRWLSHLLHERYGSSENFFEFTADRSVYFPLESVVQEQAVCFVYQPEKPRRCPLIGRDTLAIVKHHCPEVTIYTYGSKAAPDFYFDHTHLGVLSLEECNLLYNRCAVGLCLSSSNPSRVPFEMMAAGLPAVDFYGENTIYDMPAHGCLLAERNPSSLAGAIIKILQSPALQKEMHHHGLSFMQDRHADLEFEQSATRIETILAGGTTLERTLTPLYRSAPFSTDLPVPPVPSSALSPSSDCAHPAQVGLFQRLCQNRIGRVLKVLWNGYY
ncbi:MAG: glycosyltransferase family 1 protein [Proteobacteria bacterium]|nr:glycosyltransferase family 1 protein [Pseudomonadota bacterium]MBU1060715.1 glycosyltransferase family 1 protein [Pseudomonadota bacterium]